MGMAPENSFIKVSNTPAIYMVTMGSADTEYPQTLPAHSRFIQVQSRGTYDIRMAFATGKVASGTLEHWTVKSSDKSPQFINLDLSNGTLYLACGTTSQIAEVVVWR